MLNKQLLDSQNAWGNLIIIKDLHGQLLEVYDKMSRARSEKSLRKYDKMCTELEFKLQDAWGFGRDANYHRFWNRPKCGCPKLDNEDAYPTGYYVINHSCKLHGHRNIGL